MFVVKFGIRNSMSMLPPEVMFFFIKLRAYKYLKQILQVKYDIEISYMKCMLEFKYV